MIQKKVFKTNLIGLDKSAYKGEPSTLCKGCGHNSIASRLMNAAFELGLPPHRVIKLSGIGCSSKSPAYFMSRSHAFNSVHGRMPSIATGAKLANRDLIAIGISGDGDTASIGMGQFKHLLRRNLPMVYIVENNGVYGLTKGQFSATSDVDQVLKHAGVNKYQPIDICMEALVSNCGFVARSFAGDPKQLDQLLKAAFHYNGTAVIDIISPCVTFNNHPQSTKSYSWGKANELPLHDISFIPHYEEIIFDEDEFQEGEIRQVELHDGSIIQLKKLDKNYDPTDKINALRVLEEARKNQELITGLIYINDEHDTLYDILDVVDEPLATLPEERTRPSQESLEKINASFR